MEILSTSTIFDDRNTHIYWNDNNKTIVIFQTDLDNMGEIPIPNYEPLYYTEDKEPAIKREIEEHLMITGLFTETQKETVFADLLKTHRHKTPINITNDDFQAIFDKVRSRALKTAVKIDNNNEKTKDEKKHHAEFNKKLERNNYNVVKMFDVELWDYVDNSKNIFIVIIICLCTLYGYGSRFVAVNGGSKVGKSEFIKAIKKLMPNFINLGSSTPASIRRKEKLFFDKKIVYLGDKGLKGTDDEEFKGLMEVFGGLITEGEFKRDVVEGKTILEFDLESDGICVFYTQPYTNLNKHKAGDQYSSRSNHIIINPVENGLKVFLQDENLINEFYDIHKDYIKHILKNPLDLNLSEIVQTKIFYASNNDLRTAKYLRGLFKAYCQYLQIGCPNTTDVENFLEVFKPKHEVTDIEYSIYEKLYKNLNVLKSDELEFKILDDGGIMYDDLLTQIKDRKSKSFFTAKQIKTYFRTDFKRNTNLKDVLDEVPEILNNLYDAGLIERIEWQYNNQNVYYIPHNLEMEN